MSAGGAASDALVLFGASGDLAFKKIYPALHGMAQRGKLDAIVVGVARSGWTRDQLVDRAVARLDGFRRHEGVVDLDQ